MMSAMNAPGIAMMIYGTAAALGAFTLVVLATSVPPGTEKGPRAMNDTRTASAYEPAGTGGGAAGLAAALILRGARRRAVLRPRPHQQERG